MSMVAPFAPLKPVSQRREAIARDPCAPAGTLTTFGYGDVTVNNTVNYPAVGDVPTAVAQMNQSTAAVATSLNRIGGQ